MRFRRSLLRVLGVSAVIGLAAVVAPLSVAAAATLSGTVTGQLPGQEEKPVVGTAITVTEAATGEKAGATSTDAKGSYSIELPAGIFEVEVSPEAGGPFEATTIHKVEVSGSRTLNVVLAASKDLHLTGTLRNASGEGLAGASLVLRSEVTPLVFGETGADGSYSFSVSPGTYELQVYPPGGTLPGLPKKWAMQTDDFELATDETRDIDLPAPSTLVVEALGKEGAPVAGATVRVPEMVGSADLGGYTTSHLRSPEIEGETVADGRASILVFDGTSCKCSTPSISPPPGSGYGDTPFKIDAVKGATTVAVNLQNLVHLTGTLRNASGEGLAGASLVLRSEVTPLVFGETGADGSYSFSVSPGTYELQVYPPAGTLPGLPKKWAMQTDDFELATDETRDIDLPAPSTLVVEALGKEGAPVAGATVRVPEMVGSADLGGYTTSHLRSPEIEGETVADGRASILVFDGTSCKCSTPSISPPPGSGYGDTPFKIDAVKGATTVAVNLAGAGEGEGSEDVKGPQVEGLSIEPPEVNTTVSAQAVTLNAHIIDDLSGFKSGSVFFTSPSGKQSVASFEFKRVAGDAKGGTYEIPVTFEQGSEYGAWQVSTIRLTDTTGNERVLEPKEIEELSLPHTVTVLAPQPPTVTGISPSSGSAGGGTEVKISGTGFAGVTEVEFGSSQAVFEYASPNSIVAISPPGSGTVDVTVTTPAGTSESNAADRFTYGPQVKLNSSPNPSIYGQKVTFTSEVVAAGGPAPVGTVAFTEGNSTLAVANLNSKGIATLNTTQLGAGEHQIVAAYSGDANHPGGKSAPLTQVIDKASTQVTLTSSLNPAPFGTTGTLKASVFAVAPGGGTPAGTVTFREGETVLDVVQLSGHIATLSLKTLSLGVHEITAAYSGAANHEPGESEPLTQTIEKAATETSLTSTLNPAPYGSSGTLKATVKAVSPGGGTPTGTVTFREGEAVLAVVPLSSGAAKYPLGELAPGSHPITATYNGGENYEGSASSISQTIAKAETELILTSSKNPAPKGSSGTIKATVKPILPGGGNPTGTVTFREGETVLATVPLSSKIATYPLKSLPVGTHEITATYAGNANYGASEGVITQVISP